MLDWDELFECAKPADEPAALSPPQDAIPYDGAAVAAVEAVAKKASDDNRRRCVECLNLNDSGVCLAASRGEFVAARWYSPIRDLPRRCEGYKPMPQDADQRPGRERWAWLLSPTV